MFADPFGLADYIFYGTDLQQINAARKEYEQLVTNGVEVYKFEIETSQDLINNWELMGFDENGNEIPIDNVYIHLHGTPNYIISGNGEIIYADSLKQKNIDTILLTACNTGHMDYAYDNFASQLAMSQNVNQVIAPDGYGYFNSSDYVKSEYSADVFGKDRNGNGFVLFQRINGVIHITPQITEDNHTWQGLEIIRRGKVYSSINKSFYSYRIRNPIMTINQLANEIFGAY